MPLIAGAPGPPDAVADVLLPLLVARTLLRVDTRASAAQVLQDAVRELGGRVVLAEDHDGLALPFDVSLGLGQPTAVLPERDGAGTAARLRRHLPALIDDAQEAAARCDRYQRQAVRARTDALTGLPGRTEIDARFETAQPGDVICMIDLDGFKQLNDSLGHAAGDDALRQFAEMLAQSVRGVDLVGRYGGDEFVVVFNGTRLEVALARMGGLASRWAGSQPARAVSIGVAPVDERGVAAAVRASDRSLYRVKRSGGNRVEAALPGDYEESSS